MGVEYGFTCPIIDDSIQEVKKEIKQAIEDLLSDVAPRWDGDSLYDAIDEFADNFMSILEPEFEAVRSCNIGLRESANNTIHNLEQDLYDSKILTDNLSEQIQELENTIDQLEEKVEELEGQIKEKSDDKISKD